MKTNELIEGLQAAIDKLEEIKEDFPNLSWYPVHHSPANIHNANMEVLEGKNSILWKLARDPEGIKLATNLGYRHYTGGEMWAFVKYKELPGIPVMSICGVLSCHDDQRKEKICDVIKDLPQSLRDKAYQIVTTRRREVKREKHEKIIQLRKDLRELEE